MVASSVSIGPVDLCVQAVSIGPGQTTFARTPCAACSTAMPRMKEWMNALGAAVHGVLRMADHAGLRAGGDDVAVGFLQVGQREPRHQEDRAHVRPQGLVELVDRVVLRLRDGEEHARVVDEDVEPPVGADAGLDRALRVPFLGDVAEIDLRSRRPR